MVTSHSRADMNKDKATRAHAVMNKAKHGGCVMFPYVRYYKEAKAIGELTWQGPNPTIATTL